MRTETGSTVRRMAGLVWMAAMMLTLAAGMAERAEAVQATGGTVTNYTDAGGSNWIAHIFTTVGTTNLTVTVGGNVEVLVVAGGGGGGKQVGGGGGAGGFVTNNAFAVSAGTYTVIVGDGGLGAQNGVNEPGYRGQDSSISNGTSVVVAKGGGGGASYNGISATTGGSGGGGGGNATSGAAGTSGQGNRGGNGFNSSWAGGGGGGAGGDGINATAGLGGAGGVGKQSPLSGSDTWYAGGGGGCSDGSNAGSNGGLGGGGKGRSNAANPPQDGAPNTGGGGGGCRDQYTDNRAGKGGSGIVIVRYLAGYPYIENRAVTGVTTDEAQLNGELLDTGDSATADVYVYWGETDGGTDPNAWDDDALVGSGLEPDAVSYLTSDTGALTSDRGYYYRFLTRNENGKETWAPGSVFFITGEVTVEATDNTAQFPFDLGQFTIGRPTGTTADPLTVHFTMSGTATEGVHYTLSHAGSVTIPAGVTTATVTLSPTSTGVGTATLEIADGYNYPVSGASGSATVTISLIPVAHYWIGAAGANWSAASSWSATSGGAPGSSLPGADDTVIFDGNGVNSAVVNSAFGGAVSNVVVLPGYTGTITQNRHLTLGGGFSIAEGATWRYTAGTAAELTVQGNMTVHGTIQCQRTSTAGNGTGRTFTVGGDLLVGSTGKFDAEQQGFAANTGPGVKLPASQHEGRSHGGEGNGSGDANATGPTYGSVTAPTALGSGGQHSAGGGGAIVLTVTGATTLDGAINANAMQVVQGWSEGSGGSVFLTTATLSGAGTGSIAARGGQSERGNGGGGRIAVILTGVGSDFSGYAGTMTAAGGNSSGLRGAAGTVYQQTQVQGTGKGTLIVDNANEASVRRTLIGSLVTDASVGDVVIRNSGRLVVDAGQTLTVHGDWSNTANFSAGAAGMVDFAGTATATLAGNTTFDTFRCIIPGKTLRFTAGTTQSVSGGLTLTGADENLLVLESTNPAEQWTLSALPGSTQHDVSYLSVSNSIAGSDTITATFSDDKGGNENWIFSNPAPIVWTGTISTDWNTPGNWDLGRTPLPGDPSITIPAAPANQPVLDKSYLSPGYDGDLIVESGATLNLAGHSLRIGGDVTVAGTMTATGSQTLAFEGDVNLTSGTFNRGQSTLRLAGTGAQALTTGGNTFYILDIANTAAITVTGSFTTRDLTFPATSANVSFGGGFTATDLRLVVSDGATLTFAAGQAYTVNNQLLLRGASGSPVVLTSSGAWSLNANGYTAARYVDVTDSNASGGRMIYAVESTGQGSNPNWNFGNGKVWIGTTTAWTTPANWSPEGVPTATDVVLIDGSVTPIPRLQAGTTIAGLTVAGVSGAAALTIDMPYAGADVLTVTGDVDVGANGTLTHTASGATAVQRLRMDVEGNFTLAAGGAVNVDARGYSAHNGPGGVVAYTGPSHGGRGGNRSATVATGITYGSPVNPVMLGSGSQGAGGGAVIVTVGGSAVLNGTISADGGLGGWGGGSGGSVNLTAATLSGTGSIRANGGPNSYDVPAGGGRVALVVTGPGADFSNFTGSVTAYGTTHLSYSCAGTVYRQTAAQSGGRGTLTIDNGGTSPTVALRTQIPSVYDPTLDELRYASIVVTNRGALEITASDQITSLTVVSANDRLNLGPAETVLEVGELTVHGMAYTKSGLYTATDWNGFTPTPANVSGDGAILIPAKGSLFLLR